MSGLFQANQWADECDHERNVIRVAKESTDARLNTYFIERDNQRNLEELRRNFIEKNAIRFLYNGELRDHGPLTIEDLNQAVVRFCQYQGFDPMRWPTPRYHP